MPPIIGLMFTVVCLGLVAYFIDRFIPMENSFKVVFRVLCAIIAVACILYFFYQLGTPAFPSLRQR